MIRSAILNHADTDGDGWCCVRPERAYRHSLQQLRVEEIGGIVVLDSGSTSVRVADALPSPDVTVVTGSHAIGAAASMNGVGVVMLTAFCHAGVEVENG